MEADLKSFKEICGSQWSDESIKKLIRERGLESAIGIALEHPDLINQLEDTTNTIDHSKNSLSESLEIPASPTKSFRADPISKPSIDHQPIINSSYSSKNNSSTSNLYDFMVKKSIEDVVLDSDEENFDSEATPTFLPVASTSSLTSTKPSKPTILLDVEDGDQDFLLDEALRPEPFFSVGVSSDIIDSDDENGAREMELSLMTNTSSSKSATAKKGRGRPKKTSTNDIFASQQLFESSVLPSTKSSKTSSKPTSNDILASAISSSQPELRPNSKKRDRSNISPPSSLPTELDSYIDFSSLSSSPPKKLPSRLDIPNNSLPAIPVAPQINVDRINVDRINVDRISQSQASSSDSLLVSNNSTSKDYYVPSPIQQRNRRPPSQLEIEYLNSLCVPTPATQLCPLPYTQMIALSVPAIPFGAVDEDTEIYPSVQNIRHWMALSKTPKDPLFKRKKKEADWQREILMIVDSTFAHTAHGAKMMDEIQNQGWPVTTATLPFRNTIIWKRFGREHDVDAFTRIQATEDTPILPLYEYTVELDVVIAVLYGAEFMNMFEEHDSPTLSAIKKAHPGKSISLIVLDLDKTPHFRSMNLSIISSHAVSIQLKHGITSITTDSTANFKEVASRLCRITRTLCSRPYQHLSNDGPFTRYNSSVDSRPSSNEPSLVWEKMLSCINGIPQDVANAITQKYPNLRSLYSAYQNPALSTEQKQKLLAGLVTQKAKAVGVARSTKVYEYFCNLNNNLTKYPVIGSDPTSSLGIL